MNIQSGRALRTLSLSGLLCAVAPAAAAQAIGTANNISSGISQEQALSLGARMDALERRNAELEAQILALKGQEDSIRSLRTQVDSAPKVTFTNGSPTFATADGEFTASLRGGFQLDAAIYDQARAGPLATDFRRGSVGDAAEADRARDLGDGVNFRRARIGVTGRAFGDWNYNIMYEFGGPGVEGPGRIAAAFVEYNNLAPFRLRIGAFPMPTGMEGATPNAGSLFLERASPAMVTGAQGRTGAGILGAGERWNVSAFVFGNSIGAQTFDEQRGAMARAAVVPFRTRDYLLHVGANAQWIEPAAIGPDIEPGVATPVRIRDRPELTVDTTRLVDTGNIDARRLRILGFEAAGQYKAFHLQAEYYSLDIARRASLLADPGFEGWYVQGAWTLTGEPRRYGTGTASFDMPRGQPFSLKDRTWGVWELAARYSDLNLNYQSGLPGSLPGASAIRGGEQKSFTLGLNWYPNAGVRFLADYQHVDVDRLSPGGAAFGVGDLTPPAGAQIGQQLNIWSLRTQYNF